MAVWRRKALEAFPELRQQLNRRDYNTYDLFRDLVALAHDAHEAGHEARLDAVYGFAEWGVERNEKDLWNPAGVSFYEDLFHGRGWDLRRQIMSRISPRVLRQVWGLWEGRYSEQQFRDLRGLVPADIRLAN